MPPSPIDITQVRLLGHLDQRENNVRRREATVEVEDVCLEETRQKKKAKIRAKLLV